MQIVVYVITGQQLGIHPVDVHLGAVLKAAVAQSFRNGKIGVVQADIFAHQSDAHRAAAVLDARQHLVPFGHVRRGQVVEVQFTAHDIGEVMLFQHHRRLIEDGHGQVLNDAVGLDIAEQRDLILDFLVDRLVRTGGNDIREDTHRAQFFDGMLRGLGFVLAGGLDVGHQRNMDEQAVAAAQFQRNLADRLEEGLAFDVARGAADLGQHDIRAALLAHGVDEVLDLVGDVGDDLHGGAEIVAVAFLGQHVPVDLASGQIGELVEIFVDEALIVPQVQVGLRAVVGDEHLAVLIGAHGAGIDVDIRIELLRDNLQAPHLQQAPQRGRRDALAQTRNHAAGDENVLAHCACVLLFTW